MDTNRLKQFCVIAETGSLTKAAQLLHITHSGLSKSMKLLQESLRCTLLQPAGRGLALTQEGLVIYQRAKEFLAEEDRLFKSATLKPDLSTYKIGTVEIFLLPLVSEMNRPCFKNKKMTLLDLEPGRMEQMLTQNQLDVAITYAPYPMHNIEITEVGKFRLGCYYINPAFTEMPFHEIPFVVPAQGPLNNPLNIRERDGWIESLHPRMNKFEVNLLSTALELTINGHCAIHIPEFIANKINATQNQRSRLIEHPLSKSRKNIQRVFLLKRQNEVVNKEYQELKKIIREFVLV